MAHLSGCYSCIKYLMFAFNFLFWLLGCTVLSVGIWISIDPAGVVQIHEASAASNDAYRQFLNESTAFGYQSTGAYLLIGIGTFIALVGFLGCCGAIRESQFMLGSFFVTLSLIFGVLLATGVYAIFVKNDMESYIQQAIAKKVLSYRNDTNAANLMDFLQSTFKCCGFSGDASRDYKQQIPRSCGNNARPCPVVIYHELTPNLVIIAGVAIGISVVLLMGMLFSIMLCCTVRSTMT